MPKKEEQEHSLCEKCRWASRLNEEEAPIGGKKIVSFENGREVFSFFYTPEMEYEGFYCPFSRKKFKKTNLVTECENFDQVEVK